MSSLMSKLHTAIFCILEVIHKIVIFFSPKTVYFTDEKSADFRHGRAIQAKINSNYFLQRAANSNYEKLFHSADHLIINLHLTKKLKRPKALSNIILVSFGSQNIDL